MKTMILLGLVVASTASAEMRVDCNSMDRKENMMAVVESGVWTGNFVMDKKINQGEEVRVEQRYLTRNGLAMTFRSKVAGKPTKMEVVASTVMAGVMKGKMFVGGAVKNAVCSVQTVK